MSEQFTWRGCRTDEIQTQGYICPHCGLNAAGKKRYIIDNNNGRGYFILECPSCEKPTIFCRADSKTYPFAKVLRTVNYIPEKIEAVYHEIDTAISAGCYTAAVILARTAIMHIAVEQGADGNKSFQYYVNYLVERGFVPPNASVWIDTIRKMANDSVHHLELWKKEDAEKIGKFLMYLLVFIYELPASVE